jgi:hypothetical protein
MNNMLNYKIGSDVPMTLRVARADLLIALRELMYKDAELMEANGIDALGNDGCHYCKGSEEYGDGHDKHCPFANAVELLFQHRATTLEGIKAEARELRWTLVDLASADYLMSNVTVPCTHCDEYEHTDACALQQALKVVKRITTESLI